MTSYRVSGIDCAVCAQGIEEGLRKFRGVRSVSIDVGSLSMRLEADDLDAVESEARRLEPCLVLYRQGTATVAAPEVRGDQRRELILLGFALFVSGVGLAIEFSAGRPAAVPVAAAAFYVLAWLLAGGQVLAQATRNILRGRVFDELFLMSIATIGALAIGRFEEAVGVMVLFKAGELLQDSTVRRSRRAVKSLLDLRPDLARIRRNSAWVLVPAEEARRGDRYLVLPGERLPLDGTVIEGASFVDSSALTGESLPRRASPGAALLAGFIALDGSLELESDREAGESSAARIAELVENASHAKAKTERLVTRFARVYTPIVVAAAACIAFIPPLLLPGASLATWLYRALVILVISCPCALVLSVPLGYFGGIGGLARRGILVKGGEVLDALAGARTLVFDKTGTVTEGSFEVLAVEPAAGFRKEELLEYAALAESRSNHPIAASIRRAAAAHGLSDGGGDEASEILEIAGRGLSAKVGGRRVLIGRSAFLADEKVICPDAPGQATRVEVAVDGLWAGSIVLGDSLKKDGVGLALALASRGADRIAILSGDAEGPTSAAALALGIPEWHSGLLPEDKLAALEGIIAETRATGGTTVFVGDGINDAPVLARADVGIAMGRGADAAVECADIILLTDEPSRVLEAIDRARLTRRVVRQNIVFALGVKAGFLLLGAFGIVVMWEAVIADVGVALAAVLNSTRAMGRARPSLR
jgi:Cd2+/Zn2+-exporting ATPase